VDYKERFENDEEPSVTRHNGVVVHKFGISRLRSDGPTFSVLDKKVVNRHSTEAEELEWLREVGPLSEDLEHFVLDNAHRYDAIVFVTYLYAPTTLVLPHVSNKSVLVPNAHDELPMQAKWFDRMFALPQYLACNAAPELAFLSERSELPLQSGSVVAMGFEPAPKIEAVLDINLPDNFLLYAGRIQREKGCDELFHYYLELPPEIRAKCPLLLIGNAVMEIPQDENIRYLGFVSDSEKSYVMSCASALVMCSAQESLSIVLMESWLSRVPAIINEASPVLADHMIQSGGGFCYRDASSFAQAVSGLLSLDEDQRLELAAKGEQYVKKNYSWDTVTSKYLDFATSLRSQSGARRKVCFVVQRCGLEVNGGAELHCLNVAQRMSQYHDVTILTTCAKDYNTWANFYEPGEQVLDGVTLIRFPVAHERDETLFNAHSEKARGSTLSRSEGDDWVKSQGPDSPDLQKFIEHHSDDFDCFIFFTYLYATTYFGIEKVSEKALLAPLVHDEWMLDLGIWEHVFCSARSLIFNTPSERRFLKSKFPNLNLNGPVVGVAVDRPQSVDPAGFRKKFNLELDFMLYVGRIDESKGCKELFDMYERLKANQTSDLKLVLIGNSVIDIPANEQIVHLGFVDELDKWNALAACNFLVVPSRYESLSMVAMEAWSVSKPVLVNGQCEVLVDQCRRSNGGIWYDSPEEFSRCVDELTHGVSANVLGRQGHNFVKAEYSWEKIDQQYLDLIGLVCNKAKI
jgi:glycosyltransferase involved in cell wall biosynthesis